MTDAGDDLGHKNWDPLYQVLRNMLQISPKLVSFTLGSGSLYHFGSPIVPFDDSHIPQADNMWKDLLSPLRRLTLSVDPKCREGGDADGKPTRVAALLSHTGSALTHLDLITRPYSGYDRQLFHSSETFIAQATIPCHSIMANQVFHSLRTLVVKGWGCFLVEFERVLLAHAATLRDLHVLDCCFVDSTHAALAESLERKLAPALAITTAELYGFSFPEWWMGTVAGGFHVSHEIPCHHEGLEGALLGGRPNLIQDRFPGRAYEPTENASTVSSWTTVESNNWSEEIDSTNSDRPLQDEDEDFAALPAL